jgi:purine-binding chemotaxis protein CheW
MSQLSKNTMNQKQQPGQLHLVSFTIAQEEFGLDILKVREINRVVEFTRVPNAPEFISGVINLRGKVIPIVNLRTRFGFPRKESDKNTRIVVVEISGKTVGFIVDAVREVLRISSSVIEPPPPMVAGIGSEYITGVAKLENRLLILLDLERILLQRELQSLSSESLQPPTPSKPGEIQ